MGKARAPQKTRGWRHKRPMADRSDEQLMLDFQKGDDNAVHTIFERYKSPILNFSLRILGNRADAEDVTSDVFLSLFGRKYNFHPEAKFSTWLYTVARNRSIDQLRKRKGMISFWMKTQDGAESKEWEMEDKNAFSQKDLEKKEAGEMVRKAIQQLPLEQKEAIVLREYQNLSYEQISQILDCSLEKVKILIFRGREQLRETLSPFLKEGSI